MAAARKCFLFVTIWCLSHTSRSTLVGGLHSIEYKDIFGSTSNYADLKEGIKKAAEEAQHKIDDHSDRNRIYKFLGNSFVIQSQVVQGTMFHVKVDMAPSQCSENGLRSSKECQAHMYSCKFKVWSRVWLAPPDDLQILDLHCPHASKNNLKST